jgi:hypothetical protein
MSSQGVIPRTVDKLFRAIREADVHTEFTVSVSYFEVSNYWEQLFKLIMVVPRDWILFVNATAQVYCEKIRDLLNPAQDNLKMREVKQEFIIQDITEVFCIDRDSK